MSLIPAAPVSPKVFIEEVVPQAFAQVELDEHEAGVDLKIGAVLLGDEGGEWTLHFSGGELKVHPAREDDAQITIIQRVEDWRSSLWEGRPALVADGVEQIRSQGMEGLRPPPPPDGSPRPDPLKGISDLRGRIEMVIQGDEISSGEGDARMDWAIGVQIGEGPVAETPAATIKLGAAEAEDIRQGRLHPLEALITGRLQLDGDLGLILQLQAVAMTLSMTAGGGVSR